MRPSGIESLRGIQLAIVEALVPELQSAHALDVAQTLQMLIESLASEWDTAADDLRSDNEASRRLLGALAASSGTAPAGNEKLASLVHQISEALAQPEPGSLALSALRAENERLGRVLEAAVVLLEDLSLDRRYQGLMEHRAAIYRHLREVAARGWSFWDMAGFRERMAAHRAAGSGD